MCAHGDAVPVIVLVDATVAFEGVDIRKPKRIDRCIAELVRSLDVGGVRMLGSCCGHGKGDGEILLADGRTLVIKQSSY